MQRKLVPALTVLQEQGLLPAGSLIVGLGRRSWDNAQFHAFLAEGKEASMKERITHLPLHYVRAEIAQPQGLAHLAESLKELEPKKNRRLWYLATSPELFNSILQELKRQKLLSQKDCIIFEKPFGTDAEHAQRLMTQVTSMLNEQNVFLIDHYLAKSGMQALRILQKEHPLLQTYARAFTLKSVEVVSDESIGVEDRWEYYEQAGALKDMVQNHLLNMLAQILAPTASTTSPLASLHLATSAQQELRQYHSYAADAQKAGIQKPSQRETFARLTLSSTAPQFAGVTFILQTGKKQKTKQAFIRLTFQNLPKDILKTLNCTHQPSLTIEFTPSVKVFLSNGTVRKDLPLPSAISPAADEYATLLGAALQEDHTLFPSFRDVQAAWNIIAEVEAQRSKISLKKY